ATDKALPAKIVLFNSNRNSGNILYRDEFDSWAKDNANLSVIYTITDESEKNSGQQWQGERGRIDRSMLKRHLTDQQLSESVYYVCGPPGMLKAMRDLLAEMQMPKDRIKDEEFTGY
ncbi:MAG TPA: FAD-dependent oxidoreductase, partial [Nitrososphaera sp.]|nr:FAD-dependent oxidoreductase [Nitrososphaera sp.]